MCVWVATVVVVPLLSPQLITRLVKLAHYSVPSLLQYDPLNLIYSAFAEVIAVRLPIWLIYGAMKGRQHVGR